MNKKHKTMERNLDEWKTLFSITESFRVEGTNHAFEVKLGLDYKVIETNLLFIRST